MCKTLRILMVCLAAVIGMGACVGCSSKTTDDTTPVSDDGSATPETGSDQNSQDGTSTQDEPFTLVVGYDNSYPPYSFIGDDLNPTGFDIDLATLTAEKNGWEIELFPINWDDKDMLLDAGTITCIWSGFTMDGREDAYAFTDPYMRNEIVIVVEESSSYTTLADLTGARVVTQTDSSADKLLSIGGDQQDLAATFSSFETVENYYDAFISLSSSAVDAVACDVSIAEDFMQTNASGSYRILDVIASENYAVGFAKTDEGASLAETVTETLKTLDSENAVEALCLKYADYGVAYSRWILS